jgi:hypothetical protein
MVFYNYNLPTTNYNLTKWQTKEISNYLAGPRQKK